MYTQGYEKSRPERGQQDGEEGSHRKTHKGNKSIGILVVGRILPPLLLLYCWYDIVIVISHFVMIELLPAAQSMFCKT